MSTAKAIDRLKRFISRQHSSAGCGSKKNSQGQLHGRVSLSVFSCSITNTKTGVILIYESVVKFFLRWLFGGLFLLVMGRELPR